MKPIIFLLFVISLSGCATTYDSLSQSGGFYEQKVAEHQYIIGVRGKRTSDEGQIEDFAKLRAAELGAQLGYTHFKINDAENITRQELVPTARTAVTPLGNSFMYGGAATYHGPSSITNDAIPVTKPGVEIGVTYLRQAPGEQKLSMQSAGVRETGSAFEEDLVSERGTVYTIDAVLAEYRAKYKIDTQ